MRGRGRKGHVGGPIESVSEQFYILMFSGKNLEPGKQRLFREILREDDGTDLLSNQSDDRVKLSASEGVWT